MKYFKYSLLMFVVMLLCVGCIKKGNVITKETTDNNEYLMELSNENQDHSNDPLRPEDIDIDTAFYEDYENDTTYATASCDKVILPEEYIEKHPELAQVIEKQNEESDLSAQAFIDIYKQEVRDLRKERNDATLIFTYEDVVTVNRADDIVFSYRDDINSYIGGAHGSIAYVGRNYSSLDGKIITDDDIFTNKNKLKDVLVERIDAEYSEYLFDDWKQTIENHFMENMPLNITIGEEYVEVLFDPYYIGPWSTGYVSIILLYDDYKNIINKKYFN